MTDRAVYELINKAVGRVGMRVTLLSQETARLKCLVNALVRLLEEKEVMISALKKDKLFSKEELDVKVKAEIENFENEIKKAVEEMQKKPAIFNADGSRVITSPEEDKPKDVSNEKEKMDNFLKENEGKVVKENDGTTI